MTCETFADGLGRGNSGWAKAEEVVSGSRTPTRARETFLNKDISGLLSPAMHAASAWAPYLARSKRLPRRGRADFPVAVQPQQRPSPSDHPIIRWRSPLFANHGFMAWSGGVRQDSS